ncbi:hypothetical protein [Mycolicibacterium llatzerense]|uniref:hypothetical protein n=1 Tax=Mycolicibacterium llatzerense TaxID=280871 RepID=UPI0021B5EDE6|nr:hypothetical protein [Mycolicibacterium llatzerense]MCT7373003.1 hypothetical protein [Mycolicibacterium llatzerense]
MWTAQLTYDAPGLSLERRLEVVEALDANAAYDEDTGRLVLTFEVYGATTARQATEIAVRAGGAAVGAPAGGTLPYRPTRILVLPTDEYLAEAANPPPLDLSGVAEIADICGVSRQRAFQLIGRDDFPAPIGRLASGPVFTTASIHEFKRGWEPTRRAGRPPRPPAAGAPVDQDDNSPPHRSEHTTTPVAAH